MNNVTVVIPAYRAEHTIAGALASLRESNFAAEAIVVEDGVFDNLRHVASEFQNVTIFTNDVNSGAAMSRNVGLAKVSSEYVFFLDSDDYVSPDLLKALVDELNESGSDIAFGPWCFVYDGAAGPLKLPIQRTCAATVVAWLRNECFPTCCVMWRTDSLRRIGGWDPTFVHNDDAELVIRAMIADLRLAVTETGCGYYVQHDSPDRVSRASGAVASAAANRIFSMVSAERWGSEEVEINGALAYFSYEQARRAYRLRESVLGDMWHARARSLGLRRHIGTRGHRLLAGIMGLAIKERIASLRDQVSFLRHRYR